MAAFRVVPILLILTFPFHIHCAPTIPWSFQVGSGAGFAPGRLEDKGTNVHEPQQAGKHLAVVALTEQGYQKVDGYPDNTEGVRTPLSNPDALSDKSLGIPKASAGRSIQPPPPLTHFSSILVNHKQIAYTPWFLNACFIAALLCNMMPRLGNAGPATDNFNYRIPPRWSPDDESY